MDNQKIDVACSSSTHKKSIVCPHCNTQLSVVANDSVLLCPSCNQILQIKIKKCHKQDQQKQETEEKEIHSVVDDAFFQIEERKTKKKKDALAKLSKIEEDASPKREDKKKLWIHDKKLRFYILFMIFPLLQFCIFYVGVNFQSILLAFQKYENSEFTFITDDLFYNFKEVIRYFTEYKTLSVAFKNTVILWLFTAIFGTGVAIFFSYYIFKCKGTGRFFRFILFLPSILPAILLSTVFKLFTSDVLPVAFGWEKILTGSDQTTRLISVIGYSVFIGFGTQVLLYSNAMEQISPSAIEAAQIDGARPMTEFVKIILPEVMPTVSTFMIATIAGAFMNQANLYNLYGENASNQTFTLGYYMFIIVQSQSKLGYGRDFYAFASALGLFCTVIAIPLTILFRKFSKRFEN